MGKVGRVILTAAVIVAPIFPGGILGAGIALSAAGLAHALRPRSQGTGESLGDRQAGQRLNIASTVVSTPIVYGRTRLGITYAFAELDTGDTDILWIAGQFCQGSRGTTTIGVAAIGEIYMGQELAVDESGTLQSPYTASNLTVTKHLGAQDQTHDTGLATAFSAWTSSHDGAGVCYAVFKLTLVTAETVYNPSNPPEITAEIVGRFIEDPRSDVDNLSLTFDSGGTITRPSGSYITDGYRVNDYVWVEPTGNNSGFKQITAVTATVLTVTGSITTETVSASLKRWAHPDNPGGKNPALCIRDLLMDPINGLGAAAGDIDETNFETEADYCDDWVQGNGTQVSGLSITISSSADTITRPSGSFIDDGWNAGDAVVVTGSGSGNDGTYEIASLTATVLTLQVNIPANETSSSLVLTNNHRRFEVQGFIDTGKKIRDNIRMLAQACRAWVWKENGDWTIKIPKAETPTSLAITEDKILGDYNFRRNGSKDKFNSVRVQYLNEDESFQPDEVRWPRPGSTQFDKSDTFTVGANTNLDAYSPTEFSGFGYNVTSADVFIDAASDEINVQGTVAAYIRIDEEIGDRNFVFEVDTDRDSVDGTGQRVGVNLFMPRPADVTDANLDGEGVLIFWSRVNSGAMDLKWEEVNSAGTVVASGTLATAVDYDTSGTEGRRFRLTVNEAGDIKVEDRPNSGGTWADRGTISASGDLTINWLDTFHKYMGLYGLRGSVGASKPQFDNLDIVADTDLDADGGFESILDLELFLVTNNFRCEQIGMTMMKESRSDVALEATVTEEFLQARIGDVLTVTLDTPDWNAKEMRVVDIGILPNAQVRLACVEYRAGDYTYDAQ